MGTDKVRHVGVIMDGNRRWAKKNGLDSVAMGHEKGMKKLLELCEWCLDRKIPYLSVYAFSTENWNRSAAEINGLFRLMEKFFKDEIGNCKEKDIRIKVVGNRALLKERQRTVITEAECETVQCRKLTVQIALSYGGRNEITRAVQKMIDEVREGTFPSGEITESVMEAYLDTAGIPMIDIVIRTGGNHRLSNFFPWQSAYAELYFTDTLWPDFTKEEFDGFVSHYEDIAVKNFGK